MTRKIDEANRQYDTKLLERALAKQLVEYLQHANNWAPTEHRPTAKKIEANTDTTQESNQNETSTHQREAPTDGEMQWVTFGELHLYLKEVIDQWKSHLAGAIGCLSVSPIGVTGMVIGLLGFISGTQGSVLLIVIGSGALILSMIAGIPETKKLKQSAQKAMPARATRRHLKAFFKNHPNEAERYSPDSGVLYTIADASPQ